jgi:hypothetical protein
MVSKCKFGPKTKLKSCRGRVTDVVYGRIHAEYRNLNNVSWVARRLNLARDTVATWLARKYPPSQAPKRKLSKKVAQRDKRLTTKATRLALSTKVEVRRRVTPVLRLVREKPVEVRAYPSAAKVASQLRREGEDISAVQVRRLLRHAGLRVFKQPRGPALTPSHQLYRVQFARATLKASADDRQRIMFSDEKYFDTKTRRFQSYWAYGPECVPSAGYVQGGPKLMVLGFISRTHRRLVLCSEENMTNEVYRRELEKYKPVLQRHWFQQDNARPHEKLVRSGWFAANGIQTMRWPAYSPDLNVIETVWAIMGKDVAQQAPGGVTEIAAAVRTAWANVSQSTMRRLCDEFDDRLRVCIASEGRIVTRPGLQAWRRGQAAKAARGGGGR